MGFAAKIIADSVAKHTGARLTTFEITFPRIVLAEFNTHRALSRSSASSRAIPVRKQIERVMTDPFIPFSWGKNQSGMQAEEELDLTSQEVATDAWLDARDLVLEQVGILNMVGVHKQLANRLLEPWMWQTVIASGTEFSNFFALRANPQAQPEIRTIAEMMKKLYYEAHPKELGWDEWHLPLTGFPGDEDLATEVLKKVSVARSARVSYLTQNGTRDIAADLQLYDRLLESRHMSPFEHVATPCNGRHGNFVGFKQLRKFIPNESDFSKMSK